MTGTSAVGHSGELKLAPSSPASVRDTLLIL